MAGRPKQAFAVSSGGERSLAGDLRRRGVEHTGARDLGRNQKGRNHGRDTDKAKELINGKHFDVPQGKDQPPIKRAHTRRMSEPNGHRSLVLSGQDAVGNRRARDRQQRQDRYDRYGLHMVNVAAECGRKRQSLVQFQDKSGI
jgi:hypothetical protein